MRPMAASGIRSLALILAVFLMAPATGSAAAVKIGIIDTQKILKESKAARNARGVFLMDLEAKRAVLKAKQDEIRAMEEELKRMESTMAASDRDDRRERLAREVKELRRMTSDMEEELKKKDVDLTRSILQEIKEIVAEYSRDKKYSVILEKTAVVASDEGIDITDEIIRIYDSRKPKK